MKHALRLAEQGLGQVWPNPAVGCVIEKDGRILGIGRTQKGGRPHAETEALAMAAENARGATLTVTLEPCSHHGKTPPCAEAIIAAGIKKVVIACRDPNPQVNGRGIQMLHDSGIEIIEGICEQQARDLNRGFFSLIERGRPWVTLKTASSTDGFIAPQAGIANFQITGQTARQHSHLLRAHYDAILTGSGTVLADDPQLTCRLAGLEDRSPVRVLLDRRGRVPASAKLFTDNGPEVWRLDCKTAQEALNILAERGITRLLIEAGSALSGVFLQSGLVDELYWYRAPTLLGKGLPAFTGAPELGGQITEERRLGKDRLTVYRFPAK